MMGMRSWGRRRPIAVAAAISVALPIAVAGVLVSPAQASPVCPQGSLPVTGTDPLVCEAKFIADDTWTVPDGVTSVEAFLVGGGGGGSAFNLDPSSAPNVPPAYFGGGGGAGGDVVVTQVSSLVPASLVQVDVGAGGAGGAPTSTEGFGGNGSETKLTQNSSTLARAPGGRAAFNGNYEICSFFGCSIFNQGGNGGFSRIIDSQGNEDNNFAGGPGGANATLGGAGGGGAGTGGNGTAATQASTPTAGEFPNGGSGGAGSTVSLASLTGSLFTDDTTGFGGGGGGGGIVGRDNTTPTLLTSGTGGSGTDGGGDGGGAGPSALVNVSSAVTNSGGGGGGGGVFAPTATLGDFTAGNGGRGTDGIVRIRFLAPAAQPDPSPPAPVPAGPPTSVGAVGANASAVVSWSAPTSSGSFPVSTYMVTSSPGGKTCLTADLSCVVSGLTNGTSYTFTVKALSGAGWGPESAASNPVVPSGGPTPAPGPVPVPALEPGASQLTVDGVAQQVTVEPNTKSDGVEISGDDFSMNLQGLDGQGQPLNLAPDGVLILESDRQVQTSGTGFLATSEVDLYLDPPTLVTRSARSDMGTYVGTVITNASGSFSGTAQLPADIAVGDHVIQAVGLTKSGGTRAVSLGVRVNPWITLDEGTRKPSGRHDRIRTAGSSTGIPAGTKLTPYIRYSGQSSFTEGKASITVQSDGSFRWTREIRKDKDVTGYVAWTDVESNRVTWVKVR